jgi:hypothetical protein
LQPFWRKHEKPSVPKLVPSRVESIRTKRQLEREVARVVVLVNQNSNFSEAMDEAQTKFKYHKLFDGADTQEPHEETPELKKPKVGESASAGAQGASNSTMPLVGAISVEEFMKSQVEMQMFESQRQIILSLQSNASTQPLSTANLEPMTKVMETACNAAVAAVEAVIKAKEKDRQHSQDVYKLIIQRMQKHERHFRSHMKSEKRRDDLAQELEVMKGSSKRYPPGTRPFKSQVGLQQ